MISALPEGPAFADVLDAAIAAWSAGSQLLAGKAVRLPEGSARARAVVVDGFSAFDPELDAQLPAERFSTTR